MIPQTQWVGGSYEATPEPEVDADYRCSLCGAKGFHKCLVAVEYNKKEIRRSVCRAS